MLDQRLHGTTALVTGGARRIGRATCLALADAGADVVIHFNRSESDAKDVERFVQQKGRKAWLLHADFEQSGQYEHLMEEAMSMAGGRLNALVNNASFFPPDTLENISFPSLMQNTQINAWVPFALSRDFARLAKKGKIVNLIDSRYFDWTHNAHILSKHVLFALTQMTALQYAPDIAVNAVSPGAILPPEGKDEDYLNRIAQALPLKRHGAPDDIAKAVVYLLDNDFLTGQVIYVDGGRHIMEKWPV